MMCVDVSESVSKGREVERQKGGLFSTITSASNGRIISKNYSYKNTGRVQIHEKIYVYSILLFSILTKKTKKEDTQK
jgi:hypothetical protein